MSAYGSWFRRVAQPGWERLRGRPTIAIVAELERTQWLAPEQLDARQDRSLARLIAHAYANVPHYRALFDARGLAPSDITRVAELARLPVLGRDDAVAAGALRQSIGRPRCDVLKLTGGTTGAPLRFGLDLGSEYWRHAVKLRGWSWAGYRLGDRTLYYWGPATTAPPPLGQRAKVATDRLLKREHYLDCTRRDRASLAAAVELIRRRRIEQLVCYTQAGVDLARYVVEHGLRDWDELPVLCCAERLLPSDREWLERAFGPRVFETYGCREVMLIGAECDAHDGLHTSMENLVVEIVVRERGGERPARPGETGDVVITDLHNYGMPFIRYANGDRARAGESDGKRCRCGRGLRRIAAVEGRVAETLRDAEGAPVCGILFSRIFSWSQPLARAVRRWQAVQHPDGAITLKLAAGALDAECQADLRRTLDRYLPGVPVRFELVDEIPLGANGKRRTVIVEPPLSIPAAAAAHRSR